MLNLWQRIQERIRDASIRMQQISRHKLADLHPGKHWGAPTLTHTQKEARGGCGSKARSVAAPSLLLPLVDGEGRAN